MPRSVASGTEHQMTGRNPSGPVAVVFGTRPEIIKLARIVELLGDSAHVVHTGQHFDANLSSSFFTEFGMRSPDTTVGVGGHTRGTQIGMATTQLDALFREIEPSAVVVQGDTNAVTAGALAANANEIPIAHVEAGLRSFDRRMPEEHNRVIADHLSDLCLAATPLNVENLANEGIAGERVALTGNPIVEAVERLLPSDADRKALAESYRLDVDGFVLATFHRPENVDGADTLASILKALGDLDAPVLLPLHPRTQARIDSFGLHDLAERITIVDPIGYRDFIGLGAASKLIVSDSGGVQEEVSVFKRPSVVVRRSTERQEVEGTFVRRVEPGPHLGEILADELAGADARRSRLIEIPSPYGDSSSPEQIVEEIHRLVARNR
jgi:UDP-N-acetylglucosamine 2-epimerase (non-hydrolysing)